MASLVIAVARSWPRTACCSAGDATWTTGALVSVAESTRTSASAETMTEPLSKLRAGQPQADRQREPEVTGALVSSSDDVGEGMLLRDDSPASEAIGESCLNILTSRPHPFPLPLG